MCIANVVYGSCGSPLDRPPRPVLQGAWCRAEAGHDADGRDAKNPAWREARANDGDACARQLPGRGDCQRCTARVATRRRSGGTDGLGAVPARARPRSCQPPPFLRWLPPPRVGTTRANAGRAVGARPPVARRGGSRAHPTGRGRGSPHQQPTHPLGVPPRRRRRATNRTAAAVRGATAAAGGRPAARRARPPPAAAAADRGRVPARRGQPHTPPPLQQR